MKMREVYDKLVAEYPGRAVSVEYNMSTFKKPCYVYVDEWPAHYEGRTWEEALRAANERNMEIQPPPDEEEPEEDIPEYNAHAMGCGLEDRGITDRYEAMKYGWEQAVERFGQ